MNRYWGITPYDHRNLEDLVFHKIQTLLANKYYGIGTASSGTDDLIHTVNHGAN